MAPVGELAAPVTSRLVEGGVRVILVRGADHASAQALAAEISKAQADRVLAVIVDASELAALSSMLLRVLVGADKGLGAAHTPLAVVCSPTVMAALRGHALDHQLRVVGTLDGALTLVVTERSS